MFSLQAGAIRNLLVRAGMPLAAATQISQILSNSAAEYRAGPTTTDSTPKNLQYVDPDTRRHQLTGLDERADDPDYRPAQQPETEGRPVAQRKSDVDETQSVYVVSQDYARDFRGSNYVSVQAEGRTVSAGLRVVGNGKHACLDKQADTIVGKAFRAEVGAEDQDRIHSLIDDGAFETVWKTQLVNLEPITVVTVESQAGGVTVYGTRVLHAWTSDGGIVGADPINGKGGSSASLSVVTNVAWTGGALVTNSANVTVLSKTEGPATLVVEATECQ